MSIGEGTLSELAISGLLGGKFSSSHFILIGRINAPYWREELCYQLAIQGLLGRKVFNLSLKVSEGMLFSQLGQETLLGKGYCLK